MTSMLYIRGYYVIMVMKKKKELMWLETPSYCDALLFEIKNKIIYFMIVFFLKIVTCTLQHSEMC